MKVRYKPRRLGHAKDAKTLSATFLSSQSCLCSDVSQLAVVFNSQVLCLCSAAKMQCKVLLKLGSQCRQRKHAEWVCLKMIIGFKKMLLGFFAGVIFGVDLSSILDLKRDPQITAFFDFFESRISEFADSSLWGLRDRFLSICHRFWSVFGAVFHHSGAMLFMYLLLF